MSPWAVTPVLSPLSTAPSTTGPVVRPIRSSRAHAEFSFNAVAGGGEPLLDLERGTAGPQRPVLERGWRAEQGQDAVAGEVLDVPR